MNSTSNQKSGTQRRLKGMLIFPAAILIVYVVLFIIMPDKTLLAIKNSGNILLNMLIPLILVLVFMLLLNIFLKPARVAKLLGKGSGVKGILLSAATGIISTGPIYVWYPLLKDLRERGAGGSSIAIFLYNRAVKPFLLPVMVAYFGWLYVVILTLLTVIASVAVGYSVNFFTKE